MKNERKQNTQDQGERVKIPLSPNKVGQKERDKGHDTLIGQYLVKMSWNLNFIFP